MTKLPDLIALADEADRLYALVNEADNDEYYAAQITVQTENQNLPSLSICPFPYGEYELVR